MPRQTFMHRVVVAASLDQVWKSLQRPESWSRIGGVNNVTDSTFDGNGEITGYRFTVDVGGSRHVGIATRTETKSGRRLVMKIDTDQLGGQLDVELEPGAHPAGGADQTAVTVAMTAQSKGMMTAMLFPVITGAISSGFNESVEDFANGLADAGPDNA